MDVFVHKGIFLFHSYIYGKAVPKFKWLGASFSPRQPEFSAKSVYVRFVVNGVALEEVAYE